MELEHLLAPLYLSTKVCADGPNARDFGWIRLLSRSGFRKACVEWVCLIIVCNQDYNPFGRFESTIPCNPILEETSGSS